MNDKHLTHLRKLTRILYVCGASLLLAAMVLSMVSVPVAAYEWTDYDPDSMHYWCHCEPNGNCQTHYLPWSGIWHGHIDAPGNSYHADDYYGACVVPTGVPTQVPTGIPTQVPTGIPTQVPTEVPTQVPTDVPTQVPTEIPTQVPTEVPTQIPTEVPTQVPTDVPTQVPTQVPTDVPTQVPTSVPTQVPTENPPQDPTDVPPEDPTQQPPQDPTDVPPGDPTKQPPQDPTQQPPDNPPQDPNPPAGVLIPVTGIDIHGNGIQLARSLTMNLGILFFGMAMVLQAVTYRISKNQ